MNGLINRSYDITDVIDLSTGIIQVPMNSINDSMNVIL